MDFEEQVTFHDARTYNKVLRSVSDYCHVQRYALAATELCHLQHRGMLPREIQTNPLAPFPPVQVPLHPLQDQCSHRRMDGSNWRSEYSLSGSGNSVSTGPTLQSHAPDP